MRSDYCGNFWSILWSIGNSDFGWLAFEIENLGYTMAAAYLAQSQKQGRAEENRFTVSSILTEEC